jgi:hypothetical protein
MRILYITHWSIPWFSVAVGMYALVRLVRGYINESAFTDTNLRLIRIYSGLMDLQATTGLIYFLWRGVQIDGFPAYRLLHGLTMFVATLIPHFSARWNSADDPTRYLNNFYMLLSSFLLILLGLSLIP